MPATSNAIHTSIDTLRAAVRDLSIDEASLAAHDIKPAHLEGVTSYNGLHDEPGLTTLAGTAELLAKPQAPVPGPPPPPLKHLDVNAFGEALHAALKNDVTGYAMCLRQNGTAIYGLQWNWAHTPPDGGEGWNGNVQMHVASVSKLITAIAMSKLLGDKQISVDARIVDYLPTYWPKGPNIGKITFRHLMTHTSGFVAGGQTDFGAMKSRVAQGVGAVGSYHYENMNFGLCRILIAVINRYIDKHAVIGDQAWDYCTIQAYMRYTGINVLAPSGAAGATLAHAPGCALAYGFPTAGQGWNSGDLKTVSGGAGWHLSINQLLDVMGTFRRKGTIMSVAHAQTVLDSGFGIDVIQKTPAGLLYNKNGWWGGAGGVEQSLAFYLPQNMELVVLANSPIGAPAKFFRAVVSDLYLAHLV